MNLPDLFKALSDESRLRIVSILFQGDMCACKLVDYLHVTQSTASRHLSVLQRAKVVTFRRDTRKHIYSLNRELPETIQALFSLINSAYAIEVSKNDFEDTRGTLDES